MNEAEKMHAIINSNHDTFICLPSLLQAQLRDTMTPQQCMRGTAGEGEDFGIKTKCWIAQVIRWVGKSCLKYENEILKAISSSTCSFPGCESLAVRHYSRASEAGQAAGGQTVTPVIQRERSPPTGALINWVYRGGGGVAVEGGVPVRCSALLCSPSAGFPPRFFKGILQTGADIHDS